MPIPGTLPQRCDRARLLASALLLSAWLLAGWPAGLPVRAQQAPGAATAPAPIAPASAPATGLAAEHRWERVFYGQWEGQPALLHSGSIFFAKLALGDLDGDGDADLLIGKADGRIDRFEHVNASGVKRWKLVEENIEALRVRKEGDTGPASQVIDAGSRAAPALVDIDQDGDLDLFVGTGDGRLMFFRNVGNPRLPALVLVAASFVSKSFGLNLVPVFADTDGNRSPDLILGNRNGEVFLIANQGTQRRAAFCVEFPAKDALPDEAPPCRPVPRRLLTIAPETHAAPGLADWDGDGDPDLFVGKSNGTIDYYENKGTAVAGDWRLVQPRFLAIDQGGFAAPTFLELDGDGHPEMIIGSSTNAVSVYSNKGTGSVLDVWRVTGNLLDVHRMGLELRQLVIASGDLDGDKDVDLLVGDRGGRLVWLENTGTAQQARWHIRQSHLLAGTVRENMAPWLADLDGDGDLDLLVGGVDGRVWLMRNLGTPAEPQFTLETTNYAGVDVGNDSVPVTLDIDGDGDLDLVVGNRRGLVIFYRNEGTRGEADFHLRNTRFGETAVGLRAVPAFFDWNGDGKPDLVLGSRKGDLQLVINGNEPASSDFRAWTVAANPWRGFRAPGYSAPHFADLNGDGRPDLLIGDADGNVQLWLDGGTRIAGTEQTERQTAAAVGSGGDNAAGAAGAPVAGGPNRPTFASESGLAALVENTSAEPVPGSASAGAPVQSGPLEPIYVLATDTLGGIQHKGRVRPAIADLDGDGLLDIVVGTAAGRLVHYRNTGTGGEPAWQQVAENLGDYKGGGNPSPVLADLDGDGLTDLLVGTERGQVLFYRNSGEKNAPAFTHVPDALSSINVGRYAAPAVAFVNEDKLSDLVVGDFSGHLWAFVREGGAQSLNFKLVDRRYLGVDVGVAATPFAGDVDRDGSTDLLVGSDQGRVSLFVRVKPGKRHPSGWAPGPDYFRGFKFPFGTSPRLADIDGDSDLDLLLGNEKGTIYWLRNDALNPPPGSAQ